jgi:hypothetical protein
MDVSGDDFDFERGQDGSGGRGRDRGSGGIGRSFRDGSS